MTATRLPDGSVTLTLSPADVANLRENLAGLVSILAAVAAPATAQSFAGPADAVLSLQRPYTRRERQANPLGVSSIEAVPTPRARARSRVEAADSRLGVDPSARHSGDAPKPRSTPPVPTKTRFVFEAGARFRVESADGNTLGRYVSRTDAVRCMSCTPSAVRVVVMRTGDVTAEKSERGAA